MICTEHIFLFLWTFVDF